MSKKAPKPGPKRGRGRPKSPEGKPVTISANVSPLLRDALDAAAKERRWSRSQMTEFILEEWAVAQGARLKR